MKRLLKYLLLLAVFLTGCREKEPEIDVSGIRLNASELNLAVGDTYSLTADIIPSNATEQTVSWSSSSPSVATVSPDGLVSAVSAGETDIVASSGDVTASCHVFVTDAPVKVTGVSLDSDKVSVREGETVTLHATVLPETATNKALKWDCDKENVAVVYNGTVKGLSAGSATVTVTTEDGGFQASCVVTVNPDKNIITEGGTAEGFDDNFDNYVW